jgi:hypothetical protein
MPKRVVEGGGSAVATGLGTAIQAGTHPYRRRGNSVAVRHLKVQRHSAAVRGLGWLDVDLREWVGRD